MKVIKHEINYLANKCAAAAVPQPWPELLADGIPELAVALPGASVRPLWGRHRILHDGVQLHRRHHSGARQVDNFL